MKIEDKITKHLNEDEHAQATRVPLHQVFRRPEKEQIVPIYKKLLEVRSQLVSLIDFTNSTMGEFISPAARSAMAKDLEALGRMVYGRAKNDQVGNFDFPNFRKFMDSE